MKNRREKNYKTDSTHAVMVVSEDSQQDKFTAVEQRSIRELFQQGKATLLTRKYNLKDCRVHISSKVYCLNSPSKGIGSLKIELTQPRSTLYIVAHHEEQGRIGPERMTGLTPEELAQKLADEFEENLQLVQNIHFYTCNSAYHQEHLSKSYCGKFFNYMQHEYDAQQLTVVGFLGFLSEDHRHHHTYVSAEYDSNHKKRAEDQMVIFSSDGKIKTPEKPLYDIRHSMFHHSALAGVSVDSDKKCKILAAKAASFQY